MSLNQHEKFGLQLHYFLHYWAWPLPIKWTSDYTKTEQTRPFTKCIPFIIVALHTLFYSLSCFYVVLSRTIWKSQDFDRINSIILCIIGVCCLYMCIYYSQAYDRIPDSGCFTNHFIQISKDMIEEFPNKQKDTQGYQEGFGVSAIFAFVVVPITAFTPYLFTACALLMDIDAPYFFLNDLLGDPKYREFYTIYCILAYRTFSTFFQTLDFCRSATILSVTMFIMIDRIRHVLPISALSAKNFDRFLFYQNCLWIAFKQIDYLFHLLVYLSMNGIFWANVATCWSVVRIEPNETNFTITLYATFVAAFVGLTLVHVILIPIICGLFEMLPCMLKLRTLRAKLIFAKMKTKQNKIMVMRVNAILPFRIKYGVFWYMRRDFVPEYLSLLLNRCLDTILTFE